LNFLPELHLLQFVPEPLPSFRADVAALFGKYLPRHGVTCHIVGMRGGDEPGEQGFAAVHRPAATGARWRRELSFMALCLRLLLGSSKRSYDVIQVRDMVSVGSLAMLVARIKGIPFVYWMSFLMCEGRIANARVQLREGGGWRAYLVLWKGLAERLLLYKFVLPGAQHVFVQSDAMLAFVAGKGIPASKLTAVPMGVDTEVLRPEHIVGKRLPGWQGIPVVAYLGTLVRLRELHVVIAALVIIRRVHPSARLLLIGDSPTRSDVDALLACARKDGVADAVHITGWMPAPRAWPLLAGADAAISYFPRSELLDTNSPTKLLEYLALGMPSVGNDNPDQVKVLSESRCGWLTESSPAALAQALSQILDDTAAARARAASGPAYIDSARSYRAIAAMVAQHYRLVGSATAKKNGP
jgi:glycosyltransferase involved in cell wall biosynthesis